MTITFFWKKRPLKGKFSKNYSERIHHITESRLVCKFREIWLTRNQRSRALFTWQKNKTSARSPTLAAAWNAPKICQGQLQTIYSEFPKFHPNLFTSGEVIAECVNIVETCHKVFQILGKASSLSKHYLPPVLLRGESVWAYAVLAMSHYGPLWANTMSRTVSFRGGLNHGHR